ncbi:MAG TPA: DUF72 domain-containing protein [Chitinophagaceae bacterium]|nr:DUF72 domain-containing protein [Chitinophagaceae bacterium]
MPDKPILTLEERRAKRAERREKQRSENINRAKKMHVARLEFEEHTTRKKIAGAQPPQYNIGCSGWYYWHWHKLFYPEHLARNEWFSYYATNFKTVELNAPFYSWPTVATVNTWLKQAGRRQFIYTVKVCELITHVKRFKATKQLIQDFGLIADLLGRRMGCFLYQLPPSYHYTPARLKSILSQLDPRRRNVVEFRHKSWWNEAVYKAFRQANTIFCSCSGPRLPDDLIKTADEVYIRFHGTKQWYRHNYTKQELRVWAQRIRESKAKRVWAYFNNDRDGYAIKNAKELLKMLKKE